MSRVYVTNDHKEMDFSSAEKFGEIVRISDGRINIHHTHNLVRLIENETADFNPAEDYILIAGNQVVSSITMAILAATHHLPLKVLLWDWNQKVYLERAIIL